MISLEASTTATFSNKGDGGFIQSFSGLELSLLVCRID